MMNGSFTIYRCPSDFTKCHDESLIFENNLNSTLAKHYCLYTKFIISDLHNLDICSYLEIISKHYKKCHDKINGISYCIHEKYITYYTSSDEFTMFTGGLFGFSFALAFFLAILIISYWPTNWNPFFSEEYIEDLQ